MKKIIIKRKNNDFSLYSLCLFILAFLQVLSDISVVSNNFIFTGINNFFTIIVYILLLLIIFREKYNIKFLFIFFIISALLIYGSFRSGMTAFLSAWLLIVSAKKKEYKEILTVIYNAFGVGFFIGVMTSIPILFNTEEFYSQLLDGFKLGFSHKNMSGMYLAFLFLIKNSIHYDEKRYIKIGAYACGVFLITRSKTATIIIALYPILIKFYRYVVLKKNKLIFRITQILVPFYFIANYTVSILFQKNKYIQILDLFLTNRIFLNWFILSKNKITLWGQQIQLSYTGVYNAVRKTGNIITTVDNAYILMILVMGIIPCIAYVIGYICVIEIGWKRCDVILISVAVLIATYGLSEVKIVSVLFNFVYLYLNCNDIDNFQVGKKYKNRINEGDRKAHDT